LVSVVQWVQKFRVGGGKSFLCIKKETCRGRVWEGRGRAFRVGRIEKVRLLIQEGERERAKEFADDPKRRRRAQGYCLRGDLLGLPPA